MFVSLISQKDMIHITPIFGPKAPDRKSNQGAATFITKALGRMTFSRRTLRIMEYQSLRNILHNVIANILLGIYHLLLSCSAECHSAECQADECHGASVFLTLDRIHKTSSDNLKIIFS